MATIGNSYLNLIDMFRAGGDAATAEVVEVLSRLSPVARNAFTVEANSGTVHKHSIRTGLPAITWGKLYQGIPQSKGSRQQVEDSTGFVEGLSDIDTRLLDLSDDPGMTRLTEAQGFMESFSQEIASGIFYHDTAATPEKFKGLAARYNTVAAGGGSSNNVIDAGGTGSDNTSIWGVTWGDNYTHLIYPKGSKAGLQREDKGEQRVLDGNSNPYFVMEELFRQHIGLVVRDWRYNFRIANLDVSDMIAGTVDLYKFMRKAVYKLQGIYATAMRSGDGSINGNASVEGRTVIYMNRTTLEALDATGTNASNAALMLKPMELEGRTVQSYRGIPIEVSDAILGTETRVV
jgi:hypothetical protein